nr:MAG TPA: Exonuclease [Caudoviricetes sp.]
MVEMTVLKSREEWLVNRRKGLGGSDCSAVIGLNPYKSNVDLWRLKTGRTEQEDISDKPYVQYGNKAERHLRELFKLDYPQYKVDYVENNSFYNAKYPFARASLDGWLTDDSGRKGVLEIKTTEILSAGQRAKWKDRIPDNYFCQVLFYMAVIEADFAVLKAQIKTVIDGDVRLETKHYKIERADVQGDIDFLMNACKDFWQYVQDDKEPPLVLPSL